MAKRRESKPAAANAEKETFWTAARDIVQECHAILKPGGVAVWVTKDFVRNKARVPFSDDWARLCQACGLHLVRRARAMLVSETVVPDLFGGETVQRKERKSFFRRLQESKGSPRIDYEDVLFVRKAGPGGDVDALVSSPPYSHRTVRPLGPKPEGLLRSWYETYRREGGGWTYERFVESVRCGRRGGSGSYGTTPGQLAELPAGTVDAIVSSPPYAEIATGAGGLNTQPPKHAGQQGGRSASSASQDTDQRYGTSAGQLSRLRLGDVDAVVSSPPYGDQQVGTDEEPRAGWRGYTNHGGGQLATSGQLAALPMRPRDPSILPDVPVDIWNGCYDGSWNGLIVPEAFAHPAKMARGLVARIFDELLSFGAVEPGSTVVDPFGGIFTTGIEGASRGVQVYACELEPRFHALALQNIELHRQAWELCRMPLPQIALGDSRKLRQHLAPFFAELEASA